MGNENSKVSFNTRELLGASERGNLGRVKFLINNGADIHYQDEFKWSALLHACAEGHTLVVKCLIDNGANLTQTTLDGANPLHLAVSARNADLVKLLLDSGCNPSLPADKAVTPLHLACLIDDPKIVELLVEKGAEIDRRTMEGQTPLDMAKSEACKNALKRVNTEKTESESSKAGENSQGSLMTQIQEMNKVKSSSNSSSTVEMRKLSSSGYSTLQDIDIHEPEHKENETETKEIPQNNSSSSNSNTTSNAINSSDIKKAVSTLSSIDLTLLTEVQVEQLLHFYKTQTLYCLNEQKKRDEIREKEFSKFMDD
eukprot:TRINITY_DN1239_c0_g2_i2.p1 TRINITY_DN1239_c0_g2~~TRINITY_DN1239_c0_g2_i2.p1  ORF type:complete len:313 (-),score=67.20 TRINITY_DN1239_c0_g2_i2:214-1152(-)